MYTDFYPGSLDFDRWHKILEENSFRKLINCFFYHFIGMLLISVIYSVTLTEIQANPPPKTLSKVLLIRTCAGVGTPLTTPGHQIASVSQTLRYIIVCEIPGGGGGGVL